MKLFTMSLVLVLNTGCVLLTNPTLLLAADQGAEAVRTIASNDDDNVAELPPDAPAPKCMSHQFDKDGNCVFLVCEYNDKNERVCKTLEEYGKAQK